MSGAGLPERFESVAALEDFMTEPTPALIEDLAGVHVDDQGHALLSCGYVTIWRDEKARIRTAPGRATFATAVRNEGSGLRVEVAKGGLANDRSDW